MEFWKNIRWGPWICYVIGVTVGILFSQKAIPRWVDMLIGLPVLIYVMIPGFRADSKDSPPKRKRVDDMICEWCKCTCQGLCRLEGNDRLECHRFAHFAEAFDAMEDGDKKESDMKKTPIATHEEVQVEISKEKLLKLSKPIISCCTEPMIIVEEMRQGENWVLKYLCTFCRRTVIVRQPFIELKAVGAK